MSSSRSGDTARTLILIGLVLEAVEVAVLLGIGLLFLIVPLAGLLALSFAAIGIVWIFLVYLFSYVRVREGDYEGARTPTLVFAILSLITIGLISGILYLVAYVKLGDADWESHQRTAWAGATPAAPAPPGLGPKTCSRCRTFNDPSSIYCRSCGAPLP